jgi:hypothetical protein
MDHVVPEWWMTEHWSCRQEKASGQQIEPRSAIHLALHEPQAMDRAFRRAIAPLQGQPGFNRNQVVLQSPREASEFLNSTVGGLRYPRFQVMTPTPPDPSQKG